MLFAYAIIVNEYIHTEQLRLLNHMIGKDKVLHVEAYEIMLSDNLAAEQSKIVVEMEFAARRSSLPQHR